MATKRRTPAGKAGKKRARTSVPRRATLTRRTPARAAPQAPPIVDGAIQHVELYSDDPEATKRFHAEVFGWTFDDVSYGPGMNYTMFRTPGAPRTMAGGIMSRKAVPQVPPVLAYVMVRSADDTIRKIERAGGKVLMPKMTLPNVGSFAVLMDPGGVVEAIWEAAPKFRPQ